MSIGTPEDPDKIIAKKAKELVDYFYKEFYKDHYKDHKSSFDNTLYNNEGHAVMLSHFVLSGKGYDPSFIQLVVGKTTWDLKNQYGDRQNQYGINIHIDEEGYRLDFRGRSVRGSRIEDYLKQLDPTLNIQKKYDTLDDLLEFLAKLSKLARDVHKIYVQEKKSDSADLTLNQETVNAVTGKDVKDKKERKHSEYSSAAQDAPSSLAIHYEEQRRRSEEKLRNEVKENKENKENKESKPKTETKEQPKKR